MWNEFTVHYALQRNEVKKEKSLEEEIMSKFYLTTITFEMSELILCDLVNACFIIFVTSCSHKHLPISIHPSFDGYGIL